MLGPARVEDVGSYVVGVSGLGRFPHSGGPHRESKIDPAAGKLLS